MRRLLRLSAGFAVALSLLVPSVALGAPGPITTTYVSVTCFVDMGEADFNVVGRGGQTEHDSGVITNELWVYAEASGWQLVGTEIDSVRDETNYWAGFELFRGNFVVESSLGEFAGSFVWLETPSGAGGHGNGHATDGSGLLWRTTIGVVDPTATGVPACAADREVYNLTRLDVIMP